MGLALIYRSDSWQASEQQNCPAASQTSERYDNNFHTQSRGFEASGVMKYFAALIVNRGPGMAMHYVETKITHTHTFLLRVILSNAC